jgi:Ca2+-binding RTX toxin-like protein
LGVPYFTRPHKKEGVRKVRRAVTLFVLIGVGLILVSGIAVAAVRNGTSGNDTINGTKKADQINGRAGNDTINGRGGPDKIVGGPGLDKVFGGPGDDKINLADGEADTIDCGPGRDTLVLDNGLDAATPGTGNFGNCEIFIPR